MTPTPPPVQVYDPARKWPVTITLSLGMISVGLGITGVDTAIPAMMSSLGTSLHRIQWVLIAFMITRTVLIPCVGWLGQRIGDRNLFILSAATFGAGSFLCSIAWDVNSLIFFRIIQGVGVGPLIGVSMSIMYEAFPRNERGLAMGLFMTGWSLGPFFGPPAGGYLAQYVSWRTIFYLPLPTLILAVMAAVLILPRRSASHKPSAFDLLGFLTLTGGLVVMLLGLTQGQSEGWTSQRILSLFGAAALLIAAFIIAELRAEHPYVQIRYFRNLNFSISSMIVLIRVMGFRGTSFILNLFLQKALFYPPLQAGIFMLPAAVAVGIVSPFAGMLSDRFGPKILLVTGLVLLTVTLFSLANVTIWTGMAVIYFLVILKSIGQSTINAPLNSIALGALPEGESRMGSGILGLARGLGEAFGIATLSFLLERHIFYKVEAMTPALGARLTENLRDDVMLQLHALLQHAGQFGIGLEQRAESLLGFSLLSEGRDPRLPPALHPDRAHVPGAGGDGVVPEDAADAANCSLSARNPVSFSLIAASITSQVTPTLKRPSTGPDIIGAY